MQSALVLLGFSRLVLGLTYLHSINGNSACLTDHRSAHLMARPVKDVTSNEMMCNGLADGALTINPCLLEVGATVSLTYQYNMKGQEWRIMHPPQSGAFSVYLSPRIQASNTSWFKVYEDGYSDGKWSTERMLSNNGNIDFKLPSTIPTGRYYMRTEIVTFNKASTHFVNDTQNGAEFYVRCVEVDIKGSNQPISVRGIKIPGPDYLTPQDSRLVLDLASFNGKYVGLGPAIMASGDSSFVPDFNISQHESVTPAIVAQPTATTAVTMTLTPTAAGNTVTQTPAAAIQGTVTPSATVQSNLVLPTPVEMAPNQSAPIQSAPVLVVAPRPLEPIPQPKDFEENPVEILPPPAQLPHKDELPIIYQPVPPRTPVIPPYTEPIRSIGRVISDIVLPIFSAKSKCRPPVRPVPKCASKSSLYRRSC